jgi:predicted metal-binding membrane protein
LIAAAEEQAPRGTGLAPAFAAVRTRLGLVALLFVLAALGWWWTIDQMQGMDGGPWTDLGAFGWFLGVWVVMMAAMMFPSVSPTVALYARMTRSRSLSAPLLFTSGYLVVWGAVGVLAFGLATVGGGVVSDVLAWDRAGRWVAGATLIVAAVYELTPFKDVCLGKCRSPLGFLLGSWRDGRIGAARMGAAHGAWCVGCCWALMASLFALGVMSITWMAFVAGLIAIEKVLPWRRVATWGTATVLLALGVFLLAAPTSVPGLTLPGSGGMTQMNQMGDSGQTGKTGEMNQSGQMGQAGKTNQMSTSGQATKTKQMNTSTQTGDMKQSGQMAP